jgi:hypothetical protein
MHYYDYRRFAAFSADSVHLKKPSGGPKGLIGPPCHGVSLAAGGKSISSVKAGLLVIDPQRSFTSGVWMQSIGLNAESEVEPICQAFDNCARMLSKLRGCVETMFTRCPFPPGSYDWDERFRQLIKDSQLYFIKPGNSVMCPKQKYVSHGGLYIKQLCAGFCH